MVIIIISPSPPAWWRNSSKFLEDGVMQNTAYRFYRQVQENTATKYIPGVLASASRVSSRSRARTTRRTPQTRRPTADRPTARPISHAGRVKLEPRSLPADRARVTCVLTHAGVAAPAGRPQWLRHRAARLISLATLLRLATPSLPLASVAAETLQVAPAGLGKFRQEPGRHQQRHHEGEALIDARLIPIYSTPIRFKTLMYAHLPPVLAMLQEDLLCSSGAPQSCDHILPSSLLDVLEWRAAQFLIHDPGLRSPARYPTITQSSPDRYFPFAGRILLNGLLNICMEQRFVGHDERRVLAALHAACGSSNRRSSSIIDHPSSVTHPSPITRHFSPITRHVAGDVVPLQPPAAACQECVKKINKGLTAAKAAGGAIDKRGVLSPHLPQAIAYPTRAIGRACGGLGGAWRAGVRRRDEKLRRFPDVV